MQPILPTIRAAPISSSMLMQASAYRRFADDWSVRFDGFLQNSGYVLPDSERFKIGGDRLGRGFEVAEIAGDSGIGGKLELRRDLMNTESFIGRLSAYGFYDIGAAWKQDVPGRESAATAGTGFAIAGRRTHRVISKSPRHSPALTSKANKQHPCSRRSATVSNKHRTFSMRHSRGECHSTRDINASSTTTITAGMSWPILLKKNPRWRRRPEDLHALLAAGRSARGVIVLSHGFNSHSGYYLFAAEQLLASGLAVYALDYAAAAIRRRALLRRSFAEYQSDRQAGELARSRETRPADVHPRPQRRRRHRLQLRARSPVGFRRSDVRELRVPCVAVGIEKRRRAGFREPHRLGRATRGMVASVATEAAELDRRGWIRNQKLSAQRILAAMMALELDPAS